MVSETTSHPPTALTWRQLLLVHALRVAAASQAIGMVVLHAAWILLLILAMTQGAPGSGEGATGRVLMDAFRWLGGVDATGRGGMAEVMTVWAKLAVVVYLVGLALAHLRGPRSRWPVLRTSLLSAAVAFAGFGVAMAMLGPASNGSISWFLFAMTFATFLATAWAMAATRFTDRLIGSIGDRTRLVAR
ncbi:MAG: hypothetical protein ABIO38_09090 [Luteimonas sp.]